VVADNALFHLLRKIAAAKETNRFLIDFFLRLFVVENLFFLKIFVYLFIFVYKYIFIFIFFLITN